ELAHPRVEAALPDPRRTRDRRRLDQGLHDSARGALRARAGPRPAARPAVAGAGADASAVVAPPAGGDQRGAGGRAEGRAVAARFAVKEHALFLGRGIHWPIAMEGALKLKEISYIHAEAYAAGELKHGPLALVDAAMPVVAVAPSDTLIEKLK